MALFVSFLSYYCCTKARLLTKSSVWILVEILVKNSMPSTPKMNYSKIEIEKKDNNFASFVFNKNFVRKPYRFIGDFCVNSKPGIRVIVQIYSYYFRILGDLQSILRVYLNKSSKTRAKTTSAWKAILYGLQITTAWNSTGHFIVLFQIFA